jgi:hypothetical protein
MQNKTKQGLNKKKKKQTLIVFFHVYNKYRFYQHLEPNFDNISPSCINYSFFKIHKRLSFEAHSYMSLNFRRNHTIV